ncbi:MAG: UDP-2,3-diacylglucosamine diphosphatase [Sphaerotilus natans subsp. sulfidivorans]|uniref:UDP-2,3-diacylglucosamine diphosphatase n=1 Tax=Sphaerotilus sulfidivorans TaxID=639200 RepID=UPI002354A0B8|nr:UDP-2,3-diacylglucosamine diphosphatase [Sphaerotilus sulfidivorans]MCK6402128.1 UDP-2,3-diacylglucosamine diphosphatase [Sphaerotilus sulfidivorans]
MITLLDGPLGAASEIHAAPHWRGIELLSDLHLGEQAPATAHALAEHLAASDADLIVLMGDLFEVWIGDEQLDVPADPVSPMAQALQALAEAARRRPVAMLTGNRDFLLGPEAARRLGWTVLPDRCVLQAFGHRQVLVHGDAECLDDRDYQRFRAQVRTPGWREAFLARPLAERMAVARSMRDGSEQRKREQGLAGYADLDRAEMLSLLAAAGADRLIHGHTHRPGDERLGPGLSRHVLSDWDLDGQHGPARAEVLRLDASGLHRRPPSRLASRPC